VVAEPVIPKGDLGKILALKDWEYVKQWCPFAILL
jgi:hypothetical protein